MASARTTYRDGRDDDGAAAAADPFVWVSLRDPSPDELAAVQAEFGLAAPLVDDLAAPARRPVLELTGELLVAIGLERARLLVVAVDKTDIALLILKEARRFNPSVSILVRTRDDSQLAELKAAGASEVVPELLESSLMLASHALIVRAGLGWHCHRTRVGTAMLSSWPERS